MEQEIIKKINHILEEKGVILAYVFGSFSKGKKNTLSDFDIAILFSKEIPEEKQFDIELKLAGEIGGILKINRVDIVNLAVAKNPLLKHNIVFSEMPILIKDQKIRFFLERKIMQEYEDTNYLRETSFKIMRRQLKEGVFGKAKTYVAG